VRQATNHVSCILVSEDMYEQYWLDLTRMSNDRYPRQCLFAGLLCEHCNQYSPDRASILIYITDIDK